MKAATLLLLLLALCATTGARHLSSTIMSRTVAGSQNAGGFSCSESKSSLRDPALKPLVSMVKARVEQYLKDRVKNVVLTEKCTQARDGAGGVQAVVKGTNYRLTLSVTDESTGNVLPVTAVVYVPLPPDNGGENDTTQVTSINVNGREILH
eukprot:scaffold17.g573.t1